jgi:hypothetical protein
MSKLYRILHILVDVVAGSNSVILQLVQKLFDSTTFITFDMGRVHLKGQCPVFHIHMT